MRSLVCSLCLLLLGSVHARPRAQSVLAAQEFSDEPSPSARGERALIKHYTPYAGGSEAAELRTPGGSSRDIPARRIHSHNDYWREVPLFSALASGVTSVEADVWLNPKDGRLYVGHSVSSLTRARTFDKLYVSQLVNLLSEANPVDDEATFFNETDYWSPENEREKRRAWNPYWEGSADPIQLLVDLKTRGDETYHAVLRETELLRSRGWLTTRRGDELTIGAITIILTGNGANQDVRCHVSQLDTIDMFIDAPLFDLNSVWLGFDGNNHTWDPRWAPLASGPFASATSWRALFPISELEKSKLKKIISSAQARGFETRLWSPPRWPVFARERVWAELIDAGTDWLDADDIEALVAF